MDGEPYCVLNFPAEKKDEHFRAAIRQKQESNDFNFGEVWFPSGFAFKSLNIQHSADFSSATFASYIHFTEVIFNRSASFDGTAFEGSATFENCTKAPSSRRTPNWLENLLASRLKAKIISR
jgi:disulfide oxidoreductase YuzD